MKKKHSKYKGVYYDFERRNGKPWYIRREVGEKTIQLSFRKEEDAARAYDIYQIEKGERPINILKPKI